MNCRAAVWVLAALLAACGVLGCTRKGFFAVGEEEPRGVVYLIDRSGSMTDGIDFVKSELKRSVGELSEYREFHIIFYSSGPPLEMPARRLVKATEANKRLAFEFIDGIIAEGETDPTAKAIERAFAVKPEIIFFLTDSEFDRAIVGLVKRLNADGEVTVHTIAFLRREGESVLQDIAEQNCGNYKFVSEKELADLVKREGS